MRLIAVYFLAMLCGISASLAADEPTTVLPQNSAPPLPTTISPPRSAPVATPAPPTPVPQSTRQETIPASERIAHLRQAAEHLQAGGLLEEARHVRRRTEQMRNELLPQKLAELEQLQAEIVAIKGEPNAAKQIVVHVQALEISHTKLRELGFDYKTLGPNRLGCNLHDSRFRSTQEEFFRAGVVDSQCLSGFLAALRQHDLIKVLAEPTLVTVDGRPVSMVVGGEIATPHVLSDKSLKTEFRPYGTNINLLARMLGDRKLRLEIRARFSEIDPSLTTTIAGVQVPGLRKREVAMGFEMAFGQTAVGAGLRQQRTQKVVNRETKEESTVREEVETLFLVTPELVEAAAPLSHSHPDPSIAPAAALPRVSEHQVVPLNWNETLPPAAGAQELRERPADRESAGADPAATFAFGRLFHEKIKRSVSGADGSASEEVIDRSEVPTFFRLTPKSLESLAPAAITPAPQFITPKAAR